MKRIAIIGAGISGVSAAKFLKEKGITTKVFEKSEKIGGLIRCDYVDGVLFHKVGGHVFNSKIDFIKDWFWSRFNQDFEFLQSKRNAKILLNNNLVGYPIENHLWQLKENDVKQIVSDFISLENKPVGEYNNFAQFLKGNFGERLYDIYFGPYNKKIWRTNLDEIPLSWLKGKLPMPNRLDIIMANIFKKR